MLPVYKPGDHVLTFNWQSVKKGDVVVFKANGKFFIKRVVKLENNLVFIAGDNLHVSSKFSPIKLEQIIGRVVAKY